MEHQIVDTWNINNRIGLYLLESIQPEALSDVSASKGRSVAEQFAHLHNVRLMWLKASAPDLMEGLEKVEKGEIGIDQLRTALSASATAIGLLLQRGIDDGGRIKGFKPHVTAFLGYLLAHEAHHRGQIMLSLKQSGHPVDKKIGYGIWEWGSR